MITLKNGTKLQVLLTIILVSLSISSCSSDYEQEISFENEFNSTDIQAVNASNSNTSTQSKLNSHFLDDKRYQKLISIDVKDIKTKSVSTESENNNYLLSYEIKQKLIINNDNLYIYSINLNNSIIKDLKSNTQIKIETTLSLNNQFETKTFDLKEFSNQHKDSINLPIGQFNLTKQSQAVYFTTKIYTRKEVTKLSQYKTVEITELTPLFYYTKKNENVNPLDYIQNKTINVKKRKLYANTNKAFAPQKTTVLTQPQVKNRTTKQEKFPKLEQQSDNDDIKTPISRKIAKQHKTAKKQPKKKKKAAKKNKKSKQKSIKPLVKNKKTKQAKKKLKVISTSSNNNKNICSNIDQEKVSKKILTAQKVNKTAFWIPLSTKNIDQKIFKKSRAFSRRVASKTKKQCHNSFIIKKSKKYKLRSRMRCLLVDANTNRKIASSYTINDKKSQNFKCQFKVSTRKNSLSYQSKKIRVIIPQANVNIFIPDSRKLQID